MEKIKLLYEGKAKQIYSTEDDDKIIMHYKDDATAFNGVKHASIAKKGELNNKISTLIFAKLQEKGIPTHLIETLNDRDQLCYKVDIIPLEVIIRNYIAGSMSKRLGIKEGTKAKTTVFEICYKCDELNDPLINNDHAVAIGIATYEELNTIREMTLKINEFLTDIFDKAGVILIDFKIEFGKTKDGKIVLADEISPDSCRLWDKKTHEHLDKDLFRRDLGDIIPAYEKILELLQK